MAAPQKTDDKRINPQFRAQAGKGRPKGVPNKATKALKEMILQALDQAGGVQYLRTQSRENPTAFLTLVGKVLPLQVTGEDGGPVKVDHEYRLAVRAELEEMFGPTPHLIESTHV